MWHVLRLHCAVSQVCVYTLACNVWFHMYDCVKLLGLLESTQTITLVMENLAGGDVLHHIEKVSLYRESDASALVRQLVSALAHCRAQGVVHRDVKVRASVRPRCLFCVL